MMAAKRKQTAIKPPKPKADGAGRGGVKPPEVFDIYPDTHLSKATIKCDVWGVGSILYELCMSKLPFYHK